MNIQEMAIKIPADASSQHVAQVVFDPKIVDRPTNSA
jgi:hypothetical protein